MFDFDNWPRGSVIAVIIAIAILAAEYFVFTFLDHSTPTGYQPPTTGVDRADYPMREDIQWGEDSALSPDGSKIVWVEETEFEIPMGERRSVIVSTMIIEDAATGMEITRFDYNLCQLVGCPVKRVGWVDGATVAYEYESGLGPGTIFLWKWRTSLPRQKYIDQVRSIAVCFGPSIALVIWALYNAWRATELAKPDGYAA